MKYTDMFAHMYMSIINYVILNTMTILISKTKVLELFLPQAKGNNLLFENQKQKT